MLLLGPIYLLTSKMCCNLFKGNSYLFFVKITRNLFYFLDSGVHREIRSLWEYNTTFFANRLVSL